MTALLTAPAYSARVDLRSVVISGMDTAGITAGQQYTLIVVLRGTGPLNSAALRIGNRDGSGAVWTGPSVPVTNVPKEFRFTFTAAVTAGAGTILEAALPIDQIEAVGGELEVVRWGLYAGAYVWNYFDGAGEVGGAARTGYHVYQWEGAAGNSPSVMNTIGQEVSRQILRNNWHALMKLLWTPGREFQLTKRWTDETGVARMATAKAQFAGGLKPDVNAGGTRLDFSVDLLLADPFFYDLTPQVITMPLGGNPATVKVLGDFRSRKTFVRVDGDIDSLSLQGPNFINLTVDNASWKQFAGSTNSVYFVVDVEKFKTTKYTFNGSDFTMEETWTGHTTHRGLTEFFAMEPGDAQTLYAGGSSVKPATVTVTYYPAWL